MIYLDNAATTKAFDEAVNLINEANGKDFFNPSALYLPSNKLCGRIENARGIIAKKLAVKQDEIFFTSGATEANNWAIFSGFKNKRGNVVTSCGEHSSVYECFSVLKNRGAEVRFAPLNSDGTVNAEVLLNLIDENTALISIIHRSNETGIYNDIFALSKQAKQLNKNIVFHSDGVQAFCKNSYSLSDSDIDLYSISGHKIGAGKGIGALFICGKLKIQPLIFGGGQEKNMRSGTENVGGILAFAKACELYSNEYNSVKIEKLHSYITEDLLKNIDDMKVNTFDKMSNIISISFGGINAEILQRLLAQEGIIIGLGSACASRLKTNRVLSEMKIPQKYITGSIRLSIGTDNTIDEIKTATQKIIEKVKLMRGNTLG